ncbi:MAG: hypothetical protein IJ571_01975 [Ruminococcus sp.]|nr:hypothetical protein [Ruminococcus sp.]
MGIKNGFDLIKTPDDWKENALHHTKNEQIKIKHSRSAGVICAALMAVVIGGAIVSAQRPNSVKTISPSAGTEQEKADSKTKAVKNKDDKEYVGKEEAERLLSDISSSRLYKGTIVSANNMSKVMIALGDEYTAANAASIVTVSFADCKNLTFGDTGGKFYTTSDYCKSGSSIEFVARANSNYYNDDGGVLGLSLYDPKAEAAAVIFEDGPNETYRIIKQRYENAYHDSVENMLDNQSLLYTDPDFVLKFGYETELWQLEDNDLQIIVEEPVIYNQVTFKIILLGKCAFDWNSMEDHRMDFTVDGHDYYFMQFEDGTDEPSDISWSGGYENNEQSGISFGLPIGGIQYTLDENPYVVRIYDAETDACLYEIRSGQVKNS